MVRTPRRAARDLVRRPPITLLVRDRVVLDGDDPHVSVRLSLTDGPALKAPKRPRSYQAVPLAPEAVEAPRRRREAQESECATTGAHWSPY